MKKTLRNRFDFVKPDVDKKAWREQENQRRNHNLHVGVRRFETERTSRPGKTMLWEVHRKTSPVSYEGVV